MNTSLATRALVAIGTTVLTAIAFVLPAVAQSSDAPPGNNGHIKIDDVAMDDGNENVPHPGCTFVVDFFGYDVGNQTATLTFEGQAPTGGGTLFVDTWDFMVDSRETGNELNASRTVDLSQELAGIEPHPKQGWHVKLTVNVTGSQGADTKHKFFWVSECAEIPAATAEADGDEVDADEVVADEVDAEVLAAEAIAAWMAAEQANAAQAQAAEVAAEQAASQPGAAAAAPGELPRTGGLTEELVGIAIMVIAGGALLTRAGRRSATVH